MARRQRPRGIMAARRSISRPYRFKQPLTYKFINLLQTLTLIPGFNQSLWDLIGCASAGSAVLLGNLAAVMVTAFLLVHGCSNGNCFPIGTWLQ